MEQLHPILTISVATSAAMLAAVAILFRRLRSPNRSLPVTAEWIETLSPEYYRPMMRLLDVRDLSRSAALPGFTPAIAYALRKQRCLLFQAYLHCLSAEFGRVCAALKLVLLNSRVDRPDLASALLRHQMRFACSVLVIRIRVFLYRWGIGAINATSLVILFDITRLQLQTLIHQTMSLPVLA